MHVKIGYTLFRLYSGYLAIQRIPFWDSDAEGKCYIGVDISAHKQNKKLQTYIEKISHLILKGKLRLCQLPGKDPAEIIVPLTNEEISSCGSIMNIGKELLLTFWEELATTIPKLTELNS